MQVCSLAICTRLVIPNYEVVPIGRAPFPIYERLRGPIRVRDAPTAICFKGGESRTVKVHPWCQALSPAILLRMKDVLNRNGGDYNSIMLWAAVCTCYFGFLRSGEITVPLLSAYCPKFHLTMNDVSIDRAGRPGIIHLTCLVVALLAYLAARGSREGPLFQHSDGRPLTKAAFVDQVRKTLALAGVVERNYAGHSFRIGAATTAAVTGVDDSMIQTLGRWKSSAYLVYTRVLRERLAAISARLAN